MLSLEEQIERVADAALAASLEQHAAATLMSSNSRFGRRNLVGVAAAVMLIGLVGLLIGVVANTERPSDNADDPSPASTPMLLSEAESLGDSDWVVATLLPNGLEYLYPLAAGGGASQTVWYGTRRDDGASEQLRISTAIEQPVHAGKLVDIDGAWWTVSESGSGRWNATRSLGTDIVAVNGPGSFDDTAREVLAGLAIVAESALPSPPLGLRELSVEVAATEFDGMSFRLAVQESNGFACTWLSSTDGSSGGCGTWMDPSALLAITGGSGSQVDDGAVIEVAVGGAVTKAATRVDVEFVDGTIVSATPSDLSGQFDQNFWIVAANVGPDTLTGRVPNDSWVKEARAYAADGELIATATLPS